MLLYNNGAHPVMCAGWHLTRMWNTLAVQAHETI